jgi:hypothetical protein
MKSDAAIRSRSLGVVLLGLPFTVTQYLLPLKGYHLKKL